MIGNNRAYREAMEMVAFWRRTITTWTRPHERETSMERARYWLSVARAIRKVGT